MKRHYCAVLIVFLCAAAGAQTFPTPDYFSRFFVKPRPQHSLAGPIGLDQYLVDGKLHIALVDAIKLTLANNTDIRVNGLTINTAQYQETRTHSPFDPVITTSFNPSRSTSPSSSSLAGAKTLSSLSQPFQSTYSQLFGTGTLYQVTMSANKSATNSTFSTFNPAITSSLNISFSQPLLRNRGWFVQHAPIMIAQRNLQGSRANFEATVNTSILTAVNQYWDVVQARETLQVLRESQALAEASYKHDKRALELGALSPLEIFRSESQVAQRKLQVIQQEYALKQAEDTLRQTIGADLDPRIAALDLDLYESSETVSETPTPDVQSVIDAAKQARPEFEALQQQAAIDETNLRVAANGLKPDLSIGTFYSSNGLGGNQIDTSTGTPIAVNQGGILDSLGQLSGFSFPTYGMSLQLRLPLKNHNAEADMGSAMVSQRRTLYLKRQREQQVALESRNAVHQLEQAKLSVAAGKVARDLAQQNLTAEQRKYDLGAETIFFVLDAQNQLSQAQLSLVQAQIGYQRAVASLDRVSGELLKRYRVEIAQVEP